MASPRKLDSVFPLKFGPAKLHVQAGLSLKLAGCGHIDHPEWAMKKISFAKLEVVRQDINDNVSHAKLKVVHQDINDTVSHAKLKVIHQDINDTVSHAKLKVDAVGEPAIAEISTHLHDLFHTG